MLQSQVDALKQLILTQRNAPSLEQLDHRMFEVESQIRTGRKYRERLDGFQRATRGQENAATLLHSLHAFALHAHEIPE